MNSRHFREASRDQGVEKPWDLEADDDWLHEPDPETYRSSRAVLYAMMIAMAFVTALIVAGQLVF